MPRKPSILRQGGKVIKGIQVGIGEEEVEKDIELLSKARNWDAFIDVLGLAVYKIVLFRHLNDYIDLVAIDVFLAYQKRGRSLVVAVLANTYYAIHSSHEKKGGKLVCCLHALYLWLIAHTNRMKGIFQCGNFLIVLLMGTQGCINYNPLVALRQSKYPIMHPPSEESITPLIIYGLKSPNVFMLRKIRLAQESVYKRGRDLGPRGHDVSANYKNWLRLKVNLIKLPFNDPLPAIDDSPILGISKNEVVDELSESPAEVEDEKESLKRKLEKAYEGQRIVWEEAHREEDYPNQ
ncbi:hypothetical protein CR513_31857, partial [Mucuna pruriens]